MIDEKDDLEKKGVIEEKKIPKDTEKLIEEAEIALKENRAQVKYEISNINNLIKKKYLLTKSENENLKSFLDIKKSAQKLNINAKDQKSHVKNSIKDQEIEIKKLNEEKVLFERNQIQLDIVENQKLLINDYKDKNDHLKKDIQSLNNKLEEQIISNRKFLINNNELKNTISRYIQHNKNLQKTIDKFKQVHSESLLDKSLIKEMSYQIKFYQEDNVRLSSEVIKVKKEYETIKKNYNSSEIEKNDIFRQIQELNNSLAKTNIVGTPYLKEKVKESSINSKVLNNISESNLENEKKIPRIDEELDDEINDIFK